MKLRLWGWMVLAVVVLAVGGTSITGFSVIEIVSSRSGAIAFLSVGLAILAILLVNLLQEETTKE